MDLTQLSDAELDALYQQKLAETQQQQAPQQSFDLTSLSDEELEGLYRHKMAEQQNTQASHAQPQFPRDRNGNVIDTSRPIIENPDGSFSTERSITVTTDGLNNGRPTNIPTIWDGQQLSEKEAIRRAISSQKPYPSFDTIELAVDAARNRSKQIGQLREKDRSVSQPERGGFTSMAKDFLVNEIKGASSFGTGVTQAVADVGMLPANLVTFAINKLAGKDIPYAHFDINNLQKGGPAENDFMRGAGEVAGMLTTPTGAVKAAGVVGKVAKEFAPQLVKRANALMEANRLASYAPKALDAAATGGAYGLGFGLGSEDASALKNASIGAGLGAAIDSGISLLTRGKVKPKGTRSYDEVRELNKYIGDLPVDVGSLTNNQVLADKYKNNLSKIPFSGVKSKMQDVVIGAEDAAQGMLENLSGGRETGSIPYRVNQELAQNLKRNEEKVAERFRNVSSLADKSGIYFNKNTEAKRVAEEYLAKHNEAKRTNKTSLLSKVDVDELKRIVAGTPKNEKVRFEIADNERSAFGELKRLHRKDSNKFLAGMYGQLEQAAKNDIKSTFKNSSNVEVGREWIAALRDHAVNVLPYRRKAIDNLINEVSNVESIGNVLALPQNRRVLKDLSETSRKNVAYELLTKNLPQDLQGSTVSSSQRVADRFSNMKPSTRERLFTPKEVEELKRVNALNEFAKEYRAVLKRPQTGVQAADFLKSLVLPVLGAAGGHLAGLGVVLPAIGTAAAGAGLSRISASKLTSAKARQAAALSPENGAAKKFIAKNKKALSRLGVFEATK